ncbi:TetR/AcrR family transcriptional regulator [Streptacidiphilus sp. EB129]|uniref:TetR/AcrR family transcriptional regulator n=1 Tax=Streptacidiphilus sp. EB129 TaxID=3156262 RepID=UPI0035125C7F
MDETPGQRRGRGRPREVVRRPSGEGAPLAQRPKDYPATTRAILEAAHRVLLKGGTAGLTLVAVAREAHVDVTTVSYHFGTRLGLIEALMDVLYSDTIADFADRAAGLPEQADRWDAYISTVERICEDREASRAYFEIATLALRDEALRTRLARLNTWTISAFTEALHGTTDLDTPSRALAELVFAAVDGIELHHAIAQDDYPLDEVLALLERLVLQALHRPQPDPTTHGT